MRAHSCIPAFLQQNSNHRAWMVSSPSSEAGGSQSGGIWKSSAPSLERGLAEGDQWENESFGPTPPGATSPDQPSALLSFCKTSASIVNFFLPRPMGQQMRKVGQKIAGPLIRNSSSLEGIPLETRGKPAQPSITRVIQLLMDYKLV